MSFGHNNDDDMYPPQPTKVYVIHIPDETTIMGIFFSRTKAQEHLDKLLTTVHNDVFIAEYEVAE